MYKRHILTGSTLGLLLVAVGLWAAYKPLLPPTSVDNVTTSTKSGVSYDGLALAETTATFDQALTSRLNEIITSKPGLEVAVSVINLETGSQYDAGLTAASFKAASTSKVLTAAAFLNEVERGNANLDQLIGGMSAAENIKLMIEISDNDSWDAMREYLGDKQQAFADRIGLSSYVGGDFNTITASDQAKLLALLYEGEILDQQYVNVIFGHMANADATELIAAALPADATVLHKYGTLWGNLHDTAVAQYQGLSFALVVFTNNPEGAVNDYEFRKSLIHEITMAVMDAVQASDII